MQRRRVPRARFVIMSNTVPAGPLPRHRRRWPPDSCRPRRAEHTCQTVRATHDTAPRATCMLHAERRAESLRESRLLMKSVQAGRPSRRNRNNNLSPNELAGSLRVSIPTALCPCLLPLTHGGPPPFPTRELVWTNCWQFIQRPVALLSRRCPAQVTQPRSRSTTTTTYSCSACPWESEPCQTDELRDKCTLRNRRLRRLSFPHSAD